MNKDTEMQRKWDDVRVAAETALVYMVHHWDDEKTDTKTKEKKAKLRGTLLKEGFR